MNRVSDSKVDGATSAGSGDVSLGRANPDSARKFDEILNRDRREGKRGREDGDPDAARQSANRHERHGKDEALPRHPNEGAANRPLGGDPDAARQYANRHEHHGRDEALQSADRHPNEGAANRPRDVDPDAARQYANRHEHHGRDDALLSADRHNEGAANRLRDVDPDAARRAAARRKDDDDEKHREKTYQRVSADGNNSAIGGDAILNSLRVSSEAHRIDSVKTSEQANIIKSIGVEVAEKILASNEALNAKQEVRITLRESILPNTEILISKDGKMLAVNFFTSASESVLLLASKQADLRQQLLNNLSDVNDIDINVYKESAETSSGDSHDGRSRDEYVGDYDTDKDE
jgi:hypothetical protein